MAGVFSLPSNGFRSLPSDPREADGDLTVRTGCSVGGANRAQPDSCRCRGSVWSELGQQHASHPRRGHGRSTSTSGRNRCSAANGKFVPDSEVDDLVRVRPLSPSSQLNGCSQGPRRRQLYTLLGCPLWISVCLYAQFAGTPTDRRISHLMGRIPAYVGYVLLGVGGLLWLLGII